MSKAPPQSPQTTTTMSPDELEALIRRVVREEVGQLVQPSKPSILDDWSHEGPDDPAGDEALLKEALEVIADGKRLHEEHQRAGNGH